MCRKKKAKQPERPEKANLVQEEDTPTENEQGSEYTLFHVRAGPAKPYRVVVKINRKTLSMEVDTGASVSVVGKETFEFIQDGLTALEIEQSSVCLRTYTGEAIDILGSVRSRIAM